MTSAPKSPSRRVVIRSLRVLVVGYAAWCLGLYLMQDSLLFPRRLAGFAPDPPGAQRITIDSDQGPVFALLFLPSTAPVPVPTPTPRPGGVPVVAFFHGNAELAAHQEALALDYNRRGYALLVPEYRGYGGASGKPSQRALVRDALAFIDALADFPELDRDRIVYHGRSVGGGVAAQVAAIRSPRALILESTFTGVAPFAWRMGVPPLLVRNPFNTGEVLPGLACPILILHGADDDIVPPSHADRLAALSPRATLVKLPGGHNDFPGDPRAYWKAIERHLGSPEE